MNSLSPKGAAMENFKLIDHIQTAVAVIDNIMNVLDSNDAFKQRINKTNLNISPLKCYTAAYNFKEKCTVRVENACPVNESFKTKKTSSAVHHVWVNDQAIVEEVTTTPVFDNNGEVIYVIEEFRDITKLLGLKKGIIGICSYCRKIRNEDGQWVSFEAYLHRHTGAYFSHGICESCHEKIAKDLNTDDLNSKASCGH